MITGDTYSKNYSRHREVFPQCTTIRTSHRSNHLMGNHSSPTMDHRSNHPMGNRNHPMIPRISHPPTDNHSSPIPMGSHNTASHRYRVMCRSRHPKNAVLAYGSFSAFSLSS